MTLPISSTVKLPSTLSGFSNGQLPSEVLSLIGVGNAYMEKTAARAFRAMFAEARTLGFEIRQVGDYRSFTEQLNLFLSRYKPVDYEVYRTTESKHRKYWPEATSYGYNSKWWIKRDFRYATAAVPGTSNHGWGLALDIAEELDTDPTPEGISQRFVTWLSNNAGRYGVSAELLSEPWHWRYYTGDDLPEAVLRYEGVIPPPNPTPPITTFGVEMNYRQNEGEGRVLDTRLPGDSSEGGNNAKKVIGGQKVTVHAHRLGLPAETKAVAINITAADAEGPGFLTAWASGNRPNISCVNYPGGTVTGFTNVGLSGYGTFEVYTLAKCHIIVDVVGIYVE